MSPVKPPMEVTVKSRDVQRDGSLKTTCLRIVHISDTHNGNYGGKLPHGDVLIHSGDFTNAGDEEPEAIRAFLTWFLQEPHRYKILVCGNHELLLDRRPDLEEYLGCDTPEAAALNGFRRPILLNDSGVTVQGVKFYGSSWNHCSMAWRANQQERELRWARIPPDVDILITHQPPLGILDLAWLSHGSGTYDCRICGEGARHKGNFAHWGCASLLEHVRARQVPLHCFGHVHDEHGFVARTVPEGSATFTTTFSNAAMDIYHTSNVINFEYNFQCSTAETVGAPVASPTVEPAGPFWIRTGSRHVVDIDADPSAKNQKVWLWKKLRPAANQLWYALPASDSGNQFILASALSHATLEHDPRCLHAVGRQVRALTLSEAAELESHPVLLSSSTLNALRSGPASIAVGDLHVAVDRSSELVLSDEAEALLMELEHCAL